jgi:NAD(P)H-hydrate epimerase
MTLALPSENGMVTRAGIHAVEDLKPDVIAIGPGLGVGVGPREMVEAVVATFDDIPVILDADALNVLPIGQIQDLLRRRTNAPLVLTPHPGEFARLTGLTIATIQHDRIETARTFAQEQGVYVVLKGAQTVIANPNGDISINTSGNAGMATGGSGDVLTGIVAATLGAITYPPSTHMEWRSNQITSSFLSRAVYLHGHAGDLAARDLSQTSVIASDLASFLGRAILDLETDNQSTYEPNLEYLGVIKG